MTTDSAFFDARRLRKTWRSSGSKPVCVDFSLQAAQGSMTAVVGPSGCGKSTVLRLIAGLLACDEAAGETEAAAGAEARPSLTLGGKDILHVAPGKRGVGMVFQNHALFAHMRTDDNVAYGLRCRGMSRSESRRRACEFLELVGLAGFARRKPESLSGGEAQRVSLARTLIVRPELVLFDEPLSALDAPLRRKLAEDICRMQKETGFTGIFVTHDLNEAKTVADRIITMEQGRVAEDCAASDYDASGGKTCASFAQNMRKEFKNMRIFFPKHAEGI